METVSVYCGIYAQITHKIHHCGVGEMSKVVMQDLCIDL